MDVPNASIPSVITAHLLRDLLMCERRVWLDQHGDPAQRDSIAPDTMRRYIIRVQHEQRIHEATTRPVERISISSWAEGVRVTRDLMRQGVPRILGACLEHRAPLDLSDQVYILRGKVDQLLRVDYHGEAVYAPVEIKHRIRPEGADWVQLDFYVWLLGLIQGTLPPAELWLGADADGQPRRRLVHDYNKNRLMTWLFQAALALNSSAEPPVRIEHHCQDCPWFSSCTTMAQQAKSLDLLYGVSRQTRDNMRGAGIATLAQVAALAPEMLQDVKGIGPVTAPAIRANAQAWLGNRPVWFSPLPDTCHKPGWMFDLETLDVGGRMVPWCLGWCDVEGNTQIALVAPVQLLGTMTLPDGLTATLVPDSDVAWDVFAGAVSSSDGPIYHWTGYDARILRDTASRAVREQLEPRMHDLHKTFKRTVSVPLKSTSIKSVSAYLGFPWPGYDDWFAAYLDYQSWLEDGDLDALTRACRYQRADVQSLAWVWRWLVSTEPKGAPR